MDKNCIGCIYRGFVPPNVQYGYCTHLSAATENLLRERSSYSCLHMQTEWEGECPYKKIAEERKDEN